jgi:hypothetical protein
MSNSKASENKTLQMEKPSNKKKIAAIAVGLVVLVVIVAGAATQIPQQKSNTVSPYVEVDYKTIGWFYDNINYVAGSFVGAGNTYLVLNITMTNKGYSKGVLCYEWDFNATVNAVSYTASIYFPYLYNSSGEHVTGFNELPSVTLQNGGTVSGNIAFEMPITSSSYVLSCSTYFSDYSSKPQVKIFQK